MVFSRFFRIDHRSVHQAALLLGITSIANGLLGLFRDRLLASAFGASRDLDIYYAAFRVPDIIFSLSLFFVASTAFIPLFLEYKNKSDEEARDFFNSIFTLFLFSILAVNILAYILMPFIVHLAAPGFDVDAQNITVMLSRIMLLSPILLGISSLASGIVQASRRFMPYALAPIAYNGGIILGVVFFLPYYGLSGLAYGVVLGALFHFLVQVPTLLSLHSFPRISFSIKKESFRIVAYSFPRAVALSVNQLTLFILTALASTLGAGAIAIFNLSYNLYSLPLSVIGLSYSVALFPTIAESALNKESKLFFGHLFDGARHILFWTVPVTGLIIVLRAHIVRIVLGAGAFLWIDTHLAIASLFLFSFAIVTQSLVMLFVRGYYALGRVREPITYNIISALTTIVIAFFSVLLLTHWRGAGVVLARLLHIRAETIDTLPIEFLSLPLAYSIGSLVNALLLGSTIFELNGKEELRALKISLKKIFTASIGMAFVAYTILKIFSVFFEASTFLGVLLQAGLSSVVAGICGIYLARFLRIREFFEVKEALTTRFFEKGIIQPDVEHI